MSQKQRSHMLHLGDSPIIAQGNRQFVYEHPDDAGLLLKVPKPNTMDARGRLLTDKRTDRIFRRATAFRGFLREFDEAFCLMLRYQNNPEAMPLCKIFGTVLTDKGLALVYERISEPDGQLSPSLANLIAGRRLRSQHLADLRAHFDILSQERVIISNQNPANLVYQSRESAPGRWVWIDSFGCKQLIPFRRWVRRANNRKLHQVRDGFLRLAKTALGDAAG